MMPENELKLSKKQLFSIVFRPEIGPFFGSHFGTSGELHTVR